MWRMVERSALHTASVALRAGFAVALLAATVFATAANACPAGTVFSAYNGSGICAWIGQGKEAAVRCTIRKGSSCPEGTTHEHKKSDKKNHYCCPKHASGQARRCYWEGTAPFCHPNPNCARPGFSPKKSDKTGDGDKCITGFKIYCCTY